MASVIASTQITMIMMIVFVMTWPNSTAGACGERYRKPKQFQ